MNPASLVTSLATLVSEERNPATMDIDLLPTSEIIKKINDQDKVVALAVEKVLPQISQAIDKIVFAFQHNGRLIYIGAGTSGRLGVLDAVECQPTYSVSEQMIIPLIAGGPRAMFRSQEGIEDNPDEGVKDLQSIQLSYKDVVVGIAASGRTPYVIGALKYARSLGAETVALSCNTNSTIAAVANIAITPTPGPEVLTGSTRMKSGTAQKMVLNMLTTASMIRLGKSYYNLMVDMHATNEKLRARATRIVMQATDASMEESVQALELCQYHAKEAILMLLTGMNAQEAATALEHEHGFLRRAVQMRPTHH